MDQSLKFYTDGKICIYKIYFMLYVLQHLLLKHLLEWYPNYLFSFKKAKKKFTWINCLPDLFDKNVVPYKILLNSISLNFFQIAMHKCHQDNCFATYWSCWAHYSSIVLINSWILFVEWNGLLWLGMCICVISFCT